MRLNRILAFCFGIALSLAPSFAVTPAIGVASAVGTFEINNAVVNGNANLFDGSQIKTVEASSQILLQNGATLSLATNSAGTVYKTHLVLQQGTTKAVNMNGYSIRVGAYRIEGGEAGSQAVVRLADGTVQVAALNGSLNIFNQKGALLTRMGAGTASAFQQSGATAGQSGATASQTGANPGGKKKLVGLYLILGGAMAGLGIAVDAILQPTSP